MKFSALAAVVVGGLYAAQKFASKAAASRTEVHSGILEKTEYTTKHSSTPTYNGGQIAAVPVVADVTIVFFQDGTQVVINGKIDVLFPKGTHVSIVEDGFGRRTMARVVTEVRDTHTTSP